MFHQLDVQDPLSVASLAIFVHLCFGKLDILVNNAGAPGVSVDIKGLRALNLDTESWPDSDYLKKTIPFLACYPEIALVQARWKFVNSDECVITRIQEMSLDYRFKIDQEAGSSTFAFFGFNGTAGVWRISAIHDAGGSNDRTTVEDMDLSVLAGLKGWKFVYVGDIKVKNELPSTFRAYRFQQHRWSCSPANLFKKMAFEIITNKKVSFWKKFYVLYSFFFVGKIVAHTVTFIFSCVIIPISVFVPEAYAEADTFFCFVELLSGFRDNFCQKLDNSVVGIRSTIGRLSQLLKKLDGELWRHLETITKVELFCFSEVLGFSCIRSIEDLFYCFSFQHFISALYLFSTFLLFQLTVF